MENEFAQYCLKRLELLEKENAELKAKNKLLEENSQLKRSSFLYYRLSLSTYRIGENNYAKFEQAVTDWDYNWLDNNYFSISSGLADYEISTGDDTYYFLAQTAPDGKISFMNLDVDGKNCFSSYLSAKEYLIKTVLAEVAKIKEKIAEKAKAQANAAQAQ